MGLPGGGCLLAARCVLGRSVMTVRRASDALGCQRARRGAARPPGLGTPERPKSGRQPSPGGRRFMRGTPCPPARRCWAPQPAGADAAAGLAAEPSWAALEGACASCPGFTAASSSEPATSDRRLLPEAPGTAAAPASTPSAPQARAMAAESHAAAALALGVLARRADASFR